MKETEEKTEVMFDIKLNETEMFFVRYTILNLIRKEEKHLEKIEKRINELECGGCFCDMSILSTIKRQTKENLDALKHFEEKTWESICLQKKQ